MSSRTPERAVVRPPPTLVSMAAGVAVVVGLAVLISADLTDAFDQWVIDALRSPAIGDLLSPLRAISALGMVAYGILAVLVSRSRLPAPWRIGIVVALGAVVALIGISRIWLGVHYPTDVLAGWAAGGVVVLAYAALTRRVSPEPAEGAVDADPGARRSDRPAAG